MRKILIILILFFSIVSLESVINLSSVLAAVKIDDKEVITESPQCCKLKHTIKGWGAPTAGYPAGSWLGAPGDEATVCPAADGTYNSDPNWAGFCTVDAVKTLSGWITWIAMAIVGIALVFAGITFVTSAGNPERVSKAKKIFFYSLIGFLIAVLAGFIPGIVRYFVGI